MALRTYLELCRDFANEVGILSGQIASVAGQTGDALNVTRRIQQADYYVQTLYTDWPWLHTTDSGLLTLDSDAMPRASDLQTIRRDSVVFGKGTNANHLPTWMEYPEFFSMYELGVKETSDTPNSYTQNPDYQAGFLLSDKIKTAGTTYYYEYWRRPVLMLLDSDTSAIQPFDEETGRIIIARAKIWHAEHEDAPEIMAGSLAEYEDRLQRLTAIALPEQSGTYMGSTDDRRLEVSTR